MVLCCRVCDADAFPHARRPSLRGVLKLICAHCSSEIPDLSRYCSACGEAVGHNVTAAHGRSGSFALNPSEPVLTASVLSTVLPHSTGARSHVYRQVLVAALLLPAVSAAFGLLSFAVVSAAVLVPVFYVVYLYDMNVWEDEPVTVMLTTILLSALLGVGFTLLWRNSGFARVRLPVNLVVGRVQVRELLVLGVFVPVGIVLLSQIAPVLLASRPRFNHMLDGLTFGVVSASVFVAAETIVAHHSLISNLPTSVNSINGGLFVSVLVNAAVIRPLVFGCLIGLVAAEYSGLGTGAGRMSGKYVRANVEAIAMAVLLSLGVYMFGLLRGVEGALLGTAWGVAILVAAVLRLRVRIHQALLEEAIDSLNEHRDIHDHAPGRTDCVQCDAPLVEGAHFCSNCGVSVFATSKGTAVVPPRERQLVGASSTSTSNGETR